MSDRPFKDTPHQMIITIRNIVKDAMHSHLYNFADEDRKRNVRDAYIALQAESDLRFARFRITTPIPKSKRSRAKVQNVRRNNRKK